MLNPKVTEFVERATPGKRVSLILTIDPGDLSTIAEITDRRERTNWLYRVYQTKKRPIVQEFTAYEKSGLRINQLAGTPNLIVSAPARLWKRVFRETPLVFSDPKIDVTTNEPAFTALEA
jgi:hypothetical protein